MANRSDLSSPDSSSAARIKGRKQAGLLTVISCVHGKPTEFSNTHPCIAFAESAGFASWEAAVEAMKGGRVLTGHGPRLGRASMTEFLLFQRQVERDGLRSLPADTGPGNSRSDTGSFSRSMPSFAAQAETMIFWCKRSFVKGE